MKDLYWIIHDKSDYEQIRITTNTFRDVEYLHIRNYYMDFDESWCPGKGIAIPISISNIQRILEALKEIISEKEYNDIIT